MPNYCMQRIIITIKTDDDYERVRAATCDADGKVDFNQLIPMPAHIWRGNIGAAHEKRFGANTWDTWARENWGTKWGACDPLPVTRTDDEVHLVFTTAWSTPYPWYIALWNTLRLPITYHTLNEYDLVTRTGYFRDNGELHGDHWSECLATPEDHRDMMHLFGYDGLDEDDVRQAEDGENRA